MDVHTAPAKSEKSELVGPPQPLRDINLSENSRVVLVKRYVRKGKDGKPAESVHEMFWRVASSVAKAEFEHGGDAEHWANVFYNLLTDLRFMPNTPTFTGAGTPLGNLSACFVLPIEDDMGKTEDGIFQTLRNAALIQQTGGGNGFAFTRLRRKGARIATSGGEATGPVGFLKAYDQAFGIISQGGCLTPDTLVHTEKGTLRLDEIVTHSEVGWEAHDLMVTTDEGQKRSQAAFNNGIVDVLKVNTDMGISISGTPNHKVKVMTANGAAWKRLDEITTGDAILVKLGQHQGELQTLQQVEVHHHNQKPATLPDTLDEELAFFLGYLVGDGFVASPKDDHRVGVSVAHSNYLIKEMPLLIAKLFKGVKVHTQQKENDKSVVYYVDSVQIKHFLQVNGFAKGKSAEAYIPKLIRMSPPAIVGAFLRGLFEADGSVSHGYPSLMSTSERLIREAATLLIGLGCPVKLRKQEFSNDTKHYGAKPVWQLRIHSFRGLENWRDYIGCDMRSRFAVCLDFEPDLSRETTYVIPHAEYWLEPVMAVTQNEKCVRPSGTRTKIRKSISRYLRGKRNLTLSGYTALTKQHPIVAENARPINDLWFVFVDGVESAGTAPTLDIEVDDNHTYIANGMVTHNSRRGANMGVLRVDHPDVREFITSKTDETQITNFNISVALTDEFMKSVENDGTIDLVDPHDGTVTETVKARELFDMIAKYAHHNGEPGVLFLDAANRSNPVPHLGAYEATNPCITGDMRVYTNRGLVKAVDLFDDESEIEVVTDGRFGLDSATTPSTRVFMTGRKPVFRLQTKEGYYLRATADHRIMTPRGWVQLKDLKPGDRVHILNRKGGFGQEGSLELGRVLGWLVGDGTIKQNAAILSFFGDEKRELAPTFAGYVDALVAPLTKYRSSHPIGVTEIAERDEARVQSERLRIIAAEQGLVENKFCVPESVFKGTEDMQRGFLQALFTADGSFQDGGEKGASVRLASNHLELLEGVQQILLSFGIASRIYRERRKAGYRNMPDSNRELKPYWCEAQHELAIGKRNMQLFADEIGFLMDYKQTALENYVQRGKRGTYSEYFMARVESIASDGEEDVYDLTEPLTHSFVSNGITIHNCGEQFLLPYESCNLGSVNLAPHVTEDGRVDWMMLQTTIEEATRFLDDVVTENRYVPAVPQLREAALNSRRIGLGFMGLADMMVQVGIRYGSPEGQEFAAQITEFMRYHAMRVSVELAKERGSFLAIKGSIYDPDNFRWEAPQPLEPYQHDWGRPALDWAQLGKDIKRYGIRNAAQSTLAPTGTIATVAGCEGYGCEPIFALAYTRYVTDKDNKRFELHYASPLFEQALLRAGLSEEVRNRIVEKVSLEGTVQGVEELPAHLRHVFVTAGDITPEEHVRMQASMQPFIDNSISKTINMPVTTSIADVQSAYFLAWKLGCKGLTVYVTGSRDKVVLETKATKDAKNKDAEKPVETAAPPPAPKKKSRPRHLVGRTYRTLTPVGTAYITINENGEGAGQPFEVFINTSKAGSEIAAVSEAIGRLISLIMRQNSPVTPRERTKEVVRQLKDIGAGRQMGFGPNRVASLPDAIAKVLMEYLEESEPLLEDEEQSERPPAEQLKLPLAERDNGHYGQYENVEYFADTPFKIADICPECGSATLIRKEGCVSCSNCGYSEC